MDVRQAPIEFQRAALERGLIPFVLPSASRGPCEGRLRRHRGRQYCPRSSLDPPEDCVDAVPDTAKVDIGYVKEMGNGLSRDIFAAEVEIAASSGREVVEIAVLLPRRGCADRPDSLSAPRVARPCRHGEPGALCLWGGASRCRAGGKGGVRHLGSRRRFPAGMPIAELHERCDFAPIRKVASTGLRRGARAVALRTGLMFSDLYLDAERPALSLNPIGNRATDGLRGLHVDLEFQTPTID
jgi:hypothetical protein